MISQTTEQATTFIKSYGFLDCPKIVKKHHMLVVAYDIIALRQSFFLFFLLCITPSKLATFATRVRKLDKFDQSTSVGPLKPGT